jgi:hypothetical protein
MTISDPPCLATWLLRHLVCGAKRESVVGDLIEQYGRRQSSSWYWWQALTTILATTSQDIRDHKLLAVRAIVAAYGFWLLQRLLLGFLMRTMEHQFVWMVPQVIREPAFLVLIDILPAVGMGWIVGRLHRQHRLAMVLAVAIFTLFFLPPFQVQEVLRRVTNALDDPRYVPALLAHLGAMVTMFVSCSAGCGLSRMGRHEVENWHDCLTAAQDSNLVVEATGNWTQTWIVDRRSGRASPTRAFPQLVLAPSDQVYPGWNCE